MTPGYEAVIGLEAHVRLKTSEKLLCADSSTFGAPPPTRMSVPSVSVYPGRFRS